MLPEAIILAIAFLTAYLLGQDPVAAATSYIKPVLVTWSSSVNILPLS